VRERRVGFPGDRFRFSVSARNRDAAQIVWSGGGTPATGTGPSFSTVFADSGEHVVTATARTEIVEFHVTVCPIDRWLERAASFFGPSLDLSRVRVRGSWLVLGPPRTAWTCSDVVRFKRPRAVDELPSESTLIHELAHVWEHQSGQAQLLKGFVEQVGRLLGGDPYDFGGPDGVRRATSLTSFTKEGQAQIVTELWRSRNGATEDRRGVPFSTPGYVNDLDRLVEGAGIRARARARRTVAGTIDAAVARVVNAIADAIG
jgi:hypothetical protein